MEEEKRKDNTSIPTETVKEDCKSESWFLKVKRVEMPSVSTEAERLNKVFGFGDLF